MTETSPDSVEFANGVTVFSKGTEEQYSVLLVEDDADIGRLLGTFLLKSNFQVTIETHGLPVPGLLESGFDLILLDLNLPDCDGLDVLRDIRDVSEVPIMVVSARTDSATRVKALSSGANDYLAKPFLPEELLARALALLRETAGDAASEDCDSYLQLFCDRELVLLGGRPLELNSREFELLLTLAEQDGETVSRIDIAGRIWNGNGRDDKRVDFYVSRLRAKLESVGSRVLIDSKQGDGYQLRLKGRTDVGN